MKKTMVIRIWFLNGKIIEVVLNDNFNIDLSLDILEYVPMVSIDWHRAKIDMKKVVGYTIRTKTL